MDISVLIIWLIGGFTVAVAAYLSVYIRASKKVKSKVIIPYKSVFHSFRHPGKYYKEALMYTGSALGVCAGVYFSFSNEEPQLVTPIAPSPLITREFGDGIEDRDREESWVTNLPSFFRPSWSYRVSEDSFAGEGVRVRFILEEDRIIGISRNQDAILLSDYEIPSFDITNMEFTEEPRNRAEAVNFLRDFISGEAAPSISYSRDLLLERFAAPGNDSIPNRKQEIVKPLSRPFFGMYLGDSWADAEFRANNNFQRTEDGGFVNDRGNTIELRGDAYLRELVVGIRVGSRAEVDNIRQQLMRIHEYRGIVSGVHYFRNEIDERTVVIEKRVDQVREGFNITLYYYLVSEER